MRTCQGKLILTYRWSWHLEKLIPFSLGRTTGLSIRPHLLLVNSSASGAFISKNDVFCKILFRKTTFLINFKWKVRKQVSVFLLSLNSSFRERYLDAKILPSNFHAQTSNVLRPGYAWGGRPSQASTYWK